MHEGRNVMVIHEDILQFDRTIAFTGILSDNFKCVILKPLVEIYIKMFQIKCVRSFPEIEHIEQIPYSVVYDYDGCSFKEGGRYQRDIQTHKSKTN